MMYIHMFAFRMKAGVTAAQKEGMVNEIRALQAQIPEVLESWIGLNPSPRGGGYELGGAVKFATKEGFWKTGPHPGRQRPGRWLRALYEPQESNFPFRKQRHPANIPLLQHSPY